MTDYTFERSRILLSLVATSNRFRRLTFAVGAILAFTAFGAASHSLWGREWVVDAQHPRASDEGSGDAESPFRTINRGASVAQPGDSVTVYSGVYRERVMPARGGTAQLPIVYQAAAGAHVVIKGSERWQPTWERVDDRRPVYRGMLGEQLLSGLRINPYRTRLLGAPKGQKLTLGQVFVNGVSLRQVEDDDELFATAGTWLASADGSRLTIHFHDSERPPTEQLVEVTVRDRIFAPQRRGLGYIHVKGFVMEHCANQFPERFWQSDSPQAGALGCRAGHHWLIEGNTVRFANSIGIDCGYEGRRDLDGQQPTPNNSGYHVIRGNTVTDNGCCGIAGMRSLSTQIVDNVIERNNRLRHTAPEIGGIKVHHFIGGLIEGNLIRDNDAHGIWVDNVYRQARVTRNVVIGNHGNGIFIELGEGPILIDNNVIANTAPGYLERDTRGDGFYSHDASGLLFAHNLVIGSYRFGAFHLKATKRPRAGASRIQLLNNIFANNREGNLNLPQPGPDAQDNRSDRNLFSPAADYLINPWGGNDVGRLIRTVEQSVKRSTGKWVDAAPRLTFREWQQVTRWDLLSQESPIELVELSPDLSLKLRVNAEVLKVMPLPVAGVERDFQQQPIPAAQARPGPFQDLQAGENVWQLWPSSQQTSREPVEITNSIGIQLRYIPAGTFTMGSPPSEKGRQAGEDQHQVTLTRPYYMGVTEVTQEQWMSLMENNPSFVEGDEHPVDTVNWQEALEFCRRLSAKEGATYRLPTEAEWEYACRATTETPYHTGVTLTTEQANFNGAGGAGQGEDRDESTPVRTFPPNAWGLYDMHGNLWEWCADWHGDYPAGPVTDPRGPANGTKRVVRGGCWVNRADVCRSASRGNTDPENWNFNFGFRVVREVTD